MNSRKKETYLKSTFLKQLEEVITSWESQSPMPLKYSRKKNGSPFSLLKDNHGKYYVIDNNVDVTKSEESIGSQGRYKKLFSLIGKNKLSVGETVGVKIAVLSNRKKSRQAANAHLFYSFFNFNSPTAMINESNAEEDIFGVKERIPAGDEIIALKKLNMYVDDFIIQDKQYIILHHIDGIQLLNFIKQDFLGLDIHNQVDAFVKLTQSCIESLKFIHTHGIAHNDAQFKNFIKAHDSFVCTAVDLGSAEVNATPSRMENDFLILANEFYLFDQYFQVPALQDLWTHFKQAFRDVQRNKDFSVLTLETLLNKFANDALEKLVPKPVKRLL